MIMIDLIGQKTCQMPPKNQKKRDIVLKLQKWLCKKTFFNPCLKHNVLIVISVHFVQIR